MDSKNYQAPPASEQQSIWYGKVEIDFMRYYSSDEESDAHDDDSVSVMDDVTESCNSSHISSNSSADNGPFYTPVSEDEDDDDVLDVTGLEEDTLEYFQRNDDSFCVMDDVPEFCQSSQVSSDSAADNGPFYTPMSDTEEDDDVLDVTGLEEDTLEYFQETDDDVSFCFEPCTPTSPVERDTAFDFYSPPSPNAYQFKYFAWQ